MVRWLLAAVHLLGFGIGLGAVWARARSVASRPLDQPALRRTFAADSWWGVSALLLIGSGLWRLLVGTEKPTGYYLLNHVFYTKMALLAGPDQLPAGAAAGGAWCSPPPRWRAAWAEVSRERRPGGSGGAAGTPAAPAGM